MTELFKRLSREKMILDSDYGKIIPEQIGIYCTGNETGFLINEPTSFNSVNPHHVTKEQI